MNDKIYLGDAVYCEFDGYALTLTTENGYGPSNAIVLDPGVYNALVAYVERLKAKNRTPDFEEEEENDCPHDDPDCLGGADELHIACERPKEEK